MPGKKKAKPSFEVPEAVRTSGPTGWVYRSDRPSPTVFPSPPSPQLKRPAKMGRSRELALAPRVVPQPALPQLAARTPAPQAPRHAPAGTSPVRSPQELLTQGVRMMAFPFQMGLAVTSAFLFGAASFLSRLSKA